MVIGRSPPVTIHDSCVRRPSSSPERKVNVSISGGSEKGEEEEEVIILYVVGRKDSDNFMKSSEYKGRMVGEAEGGKERSKE